MSKKEISAKACFADWITTGPFLLLFVLLLVVMDPIERIALACGRKSQDAAFFALNNLIVFCLKVTGTRFSVEQSPLLDADGSYIIVANHQSLFDISIIASTLGRYKPKFIAKQELSRWIPSISIVLRKGEHALIDRSDARSALRVISKVGKRMVPDEFSLVIFPEGTRARDGQLKAFHHAGLSALLKSAPSATVIPVTVDGTWKLSAFNLLPIPRKVKVQVVVGEPLTQDKHKSCKDFVEEIHKIIENTLTEIRVNS